jgi:hypothetical protein
MLDVILDQLDRLKLHAQDIGKEIQTQKVLIKKVNNHVDRAREGLVKQSSDLEELLGQYRSTNKCCKDIVMFLILLGLIVANYKLLVWKNWIPNLSK